MDPDPGGPKNIRIRTRNTDSNSKFSHNFSLVVHVISIVKQQKETTGQPFVFTNIFITMHYVKNIYCYYYRLFFLRKLKTMLIVSPSRKR